MPADFATRLRTIRGERNRKRADVARDAGLSPAVYGRYERGERLPTVDTARDIADALEVSLDYLTGKSRLDLDEPTRRRIELVAQMSPEDKDYVFTLMDAFIARTRLRELV